MRFCFDAVMQGTLADGAKLEILQMPGEAWCTQCKKSVRVQQRFDPCPECGGFSLQITSGDQMQVKELEVE
jgi:hydrogenase nickel incorporation protein HypA/HybF